MQVRGDDPFKGILMGRTVIVGVGNVLHGDDGLGPALAGRLRDTSAAVCIDAGASPENSLRAIARERPDTVLFVDAVSMDGAPGDWALLGPGELPRSCTSTHDIPMGMLAELLARDTGAGVFVLGVQPRDLTPGAGLSPEVEGALGRLEQLIREAAGESAP